MHDLKPWGPPFVVVSRSFSKGFAGGFHVFCFFFWRCFPPQAANLQWPLLGSPHLISAWLGESPAFSMYMVTASKPRRPAGFLSEKNLKKNSKQTRKTFPEMGTLTRNPSEAYKFFCKATESIPLPTIANLVWGSSRCYFDHYRRALPAPCGWCRWSAPRRGPDREWFVEKLLIHLYYCWLLSFLFYIVSIVCSRFLSCWFLGHLVSDCETIWVKNRGY